MAGAPTVRGLRGATTVDEDTVAQVTERSQELMRELMTQNDLVEDDIISVLFTATADVTSTFPATAIREIGFGAVPLLCAAEIAVPGAKPLCIRVLLHVYTTRSREEIRHVYLHGAQGLRDDLPAEVGERRRALVVGTGLIGGSIALGLRQRGWHVSGLDVDEERLRAALQAEVIDVAGDDLQAEIVFVAVPAAAVAGVARRLLEDDGRLADAVVTDVSGVKTSIVEEADHPRFIGGHPMAGSEQTGLHGADPDLFVGAVWALTPTAATELEAFDRLKGVVTGLGADVLVLSAADHDRLVAVVSHVPHLVAATLMNAATDGAEQDRTLLRLAAGGFRDMTRVAAGHPGIWPDICAENATAIVGALDALLTDLGAMRDRVADQDRDGILATLQRASAARRSLPARAVRPDHLAELRIRVPDRDGVIAEIASLAANAGIGIYDIEIAHSAEGDLGVLILVVDGADADILTVAVESAGYRARAEQLS